MRFTAKIIELFSKERAVVVSAKDAEKANLKEFDRVKLTAEESAVTAMLYVTEDFDDVGTIRVSEGIAKEAGIEEGDEITLSLAPRPRSVSLIKAKMAGDVLSGEQISTIVRDIVHGDVGPLETLAFAMAQKYVGMNDNETEALTKALVDTGDTLEFDSPTYDKHSIGGVPGNKVSLLIVPIVASSGLLIPKTSSRAITSPAGTADTMEVLASVEFSGSELKDIARRTGGTIAWGGMLKLAPGDDIIIRAEHVVGIDPESQMLASILAKKMAAGVGNLVLDIPTGKGAKVETMEEAVSLANKFIDLGRRLNIQVRCGVTYGGQPIGHAIGPALEAREALSALMGDGPSSLMEKSISLSGLILEMAGTAPSGRGYEMAREALSKGKAYEKMKEIIEAQGGDPDVRPEDIEIGDHAHRVQAPVDGYVTSVDNGILTEIAKAAGTPREKGAGVVLHVKRGHKVKKDETILEIFAERSGKLQDAVKVLRRESPLIIEGMLLRTVPETRFIG